MGTGNFKGVKIANERHEDSHRVVLLFHVDRLDVTSRKFSPFEYNTLCSTIPTSWQLKVKCERMPGNNDYYTFLAKLKRKDSSEGRVKASLFVRFFDIRRNPLIREIAVNRDGMECEEKLRCPLNNIPPEELFKVTCVRVTILIENCHSVGSVFRCAQRINAGKNSKYLSKL